jgi:hypothetical protein
MTALALIVRATWAADFRAFIPVHVHPSKAFEDHLDGRLDMALLICVVNPQDKLTAEVSGQKPVKEGGTNAPNVQITRGAWCESRANGHDRPGLSSVSKAKSGSVWVELCPKSEIVVKA